MVTAEDQRWLFQNLTPEKFMDICVYQKEKYGTSMAICSFIGIRLLQEKKESLSQRHLIFLEKAYPFFGDLDISAYRRFYIFSPYQVIKDSHSELIRRFKKAYNPTKEFNNGGLIEYIKAQDKELDFSKRKAKRNRNRYDAVKMKELFDCFDNFKRKVYPITDNIQITLSAKQFIHILIGHVDSYLTPRKGKMSQFKNIGHWKELLLLISMAIEFICDDIIHHYSNSQSDYNNKKIKLNGILYGIHITKNRNIKTFYPIG